MKSNGCWSARHARKAVFACSTPRTFSESKFIRRAQRLGFSLPEIRELLVIQRDESETCSHVRDLMQAKLAQIHSVQAWLFLCCFRLVRAASAWRIASRLDGKHEAMPWT